ncbi:MAG: hypothetical protein IJ779_05360, partial [Ruminococcus sp.]|nr:hypothetical protein [Ruminococcus sp.]
LTLEELLRRAGSERQGGKAQECCRISRLSDAVFRCQDKQETSRVSWVSNNTLIHSKRCLITKRKLLTYEEIGSIIVNGKGAMLLIFMTERICLYGNL